MGTIIHVDFSKRARDKGAAKDAPQADPAAEGQPARMFAHPHKEFASVRTLGGRFDDKGIVAVVPRGNGFMGLQFTETANPMNLSDEKPVAAANLTREQLDKFFDMQSPDSLCDLTPHFQRMAKMTPDPDHEQALYSMKIKDIHIIDQPGLFQYGGSHTAAHYAKGDAIIVFEYGHSVAGPAHMVLPRVIARDEDARIALQAAWQTLPDPNAPGFHF